MSVQFDHGMVINVDAEKLNQTISEKSKQNTSNGGNAKLWLGFICWSLSISCKNIIFYLWNKEITSKSDDPLEYSGNLLEMVFALVIQFFVFILKYFTIYYRTLSAWTICFCKRFFMFIIDISFCRIYSEDLITTQMVALHNVPL